MLVALDLVKAFFVYVQLRSVGCNVAFTDKQTQVAFPRAFGRGVKLGTSSFSLPHPVLPSYP